MIDNNEEVIIENTNENKVSKKMPWEFSTAGMVVGFFFGFAPLLIALMGNYQFKKGYDAEELRKAYKIVFIVCIILIGLIILLYLLVGIISLIAYGNNFHSRF